MTTEFDNITIILASRCFQYQFLQKIFGNEPSLELIEIGVREHTKEALELLLDETDHRFKDYLALLAGLKQELALDAPATLSKLKDEYARLFIGPNTLPAPPWESVYISNERTLFQPNTLEVRRIYAEYNFLPGNYPHEADDHLALELDFMHNLARMAQTFCEEGNNGQAKKVLGIQKGFLEQHLLNWIGDFVSDIQKSKTRHLYPQTAVVAEQVLILDREILDELVSIL